MGLPKESFVWVWSSSRGSSSLFKNERWISNLITQSVKKNWWGLLAWTDWPLKYSTASGKSMEIYRQATAKSLFHMWLSQALVLSAYWWSGSFECLYWGWIWRQNSNLSSFYQKTLRQLKIIGSNFWNKEFYWKSQRGLFCFCKKYKNVEFDLEGKVGKVYAVTKLVCQKLCCDRFSKQLTVMA